eukprot:NODE_3200_length_965_cov_2.381004_g2661_i0.p1 GENE.NODE_3200_length_965_cov_2.381004_g2661_i0~~NODE_3200_length_965_cov_2.381004_g2661_i0.p1  ORF type:complete len:65 (+),score=3.71 NODE_3200_length_965_cov_2.381004_g2661_i0:415-609(+)
MGRTRGLGLSAFGRPFFGPFLGPKKGLFLGDWLSPPGPVVLEDWASRPPADLFWLFFGAKKGGG